MHLSLIRHAARLFRPVAATAAAAALFCAEAAGTQDPPAAGNEFFQVRAIGGYLRADDRWQISFDSALPLNGRIVPLHGESELKYEDRRGYPVGVGARWTPLRNANGAFDIEASYLRFHLTDGTDTDTDRATLGDPSQPLFNGAWSVSESDLESDGSSWDTELGWTFPPASGSIPLSVRAFAGYAQRHDELESRNLRQVYSLFGPIPPDLSGVLDSTYDLTWQTVKAGADITLPLTAALSLSGRAALLTVIDYKADAVWWLREDLAHNPSFRHESRGGAGMELRLGLEGAAIRRSGWSAGWGIHAFYEHMETRDGRDTTFFADGSSGDANLDEAQRSVSGVQAYAAVAF